MSKGQTTYAISVAELRQTTREKESTETTGYAATDVQGGTI